MHVHGAHGVGCIMCSDTSEAAVKASGGLTVHACWAGKRFAAPQEAVQGKAAGFGEGAERRQEVRQDAEDVHNERRGQQSLPQAETG